MKFSSGPWYAVANTSSGCKHLVGKQAANIQSLIQTLSGIQQARHYSGKCQTLRENSEHNSPIFTSFVFYSTERLVINKHYMLYVMLGSPKYSEEK